MIPPQIAGVETPTIEDNPWLVYLLTTTKENGKITRHATGAGKMPISP